MQLLNLQIEYFTPEVIAFHKTLKTTEIRLYKWIWTSQ